MADLLDNPFLLEKAYKAHFAYLSENGAEAEGGSRAIAAGRTAGLAWDANHINAGQAIWSKEIPPIAGMPSFAEFRAGYEASRANFGDFATGAGTYTVAGTPFSNAAGSYARALDIATHVKTPAGEDSPEYWAGYHGKKSLEAAGFRQQGEQLMQAVLTGKALEPVKAKTV